METAFEKQSFDKRLKSMLKVDFKRMFTMPLVYIMTGVCFAIPILVLVMTTLMGGGEGAEAGAFTNVWQTVGALSGTAMSMDLTGMCNINLSYFLVAVFVCIYVAQEFKSGYAKNLFAARACKSDYVVSKSVVGFVGGAIMVVAYFIGAMLGGAIAGLPFGVGKAGAGGIAACLVAKIFLVAIFVAVPILAGAAAKQRLWLSILCSLAAGMLLFTVIPMTAPLDSNFLNVVMCLVGGAAIAAGLGAVSCEVLKKTNLV